MNWLRRLLAAIEANTAQLAKLTEAMQGIREELIADRLAEEAEAAGQATAAGDDTPDADEGNPHGYLG